MSDNKDTTDNKSEFKNNRSRSRNKSTKPNETSARYNSKEEVEGAVLSLLDHVFTNEPEKSFVTFRSRDVARGRMDYRGRGTPPVSKSRIHQISVWLSENLDTVIGGRYYIDFFKRSKKKGMHVRAVPLSDDDSLTEDIDTDEKTGETIEEEVAQVET